jgi:hypothetical protein
MMEANHSRWQKLRSPHSTNPVQRAIPAQLWLYATLKVSKLHDVCLRSFVRCFIPPLQQVCTPFQQVFALFLLFSEKNASRGSCRSPQLFEKKHGHAELHRGWR